MAVSEGVNPASARLREISLSILRTRYFLERTLQAAGYEVVAVGNGRQLVERFREETPDLVITDVKMPLMNGFEAVSEIRREGENHHIPVIFVSATYRDIASKHNGLESGGNDYLPQPIDPEELLFRTNGVRLG